MGPFTRPEKKATARQPTFPSTASRPNSKTNKKRQCSAAGWWVSHSLTADPAPEMRARSSYFALDFLFRTRAGFVESSRTYCTSSTRPAWRFHVPRIWNRSINVCEFPVKRKTQNVVDLFAPRLFVVVPFPGNYFACNDFRAISSRVTLTASNSQNAIPYKARAPDSLTCFCLRTSRASLRANVSGIIRNTLFLRRKNAHRRRPQFRKDQ